MGTVYAGGSRGLAAQRLDRSTSEEAVMAGCDQRGWHEVGPRQQMETLGKVAEAELQTGSRAESPRLGEGGEQE